jgi:hypothetical protein
MRMPSILKSTLFAVAATALATTAAVAGPFGSGGQIDTSETSYESVVTKPGDVLNGIFNVAQINTATGISYNYGDGDYYLVGRFTGFTLSVVQATPPSIFEPLGGFNLAFTGGSLQYYSFNFDPFESGALTTGPAANQAASLAAIGAGLLELDLTPQLLPDGIHTLGIHVSGTLTGFTSASTSSVFLDIIGGASAGLFDLDSIQNAFTLAMADAVYQGSANTQQCAISPQWQVCGTNHATLNVIPEPITLSLFGAGLVGAAALRRRKAQKA